MKKLRMTSLALSAVLLCGNTAVHASAEEPVRLTFWHSCSAESGEKLREYVDSFNATIGLQMGVEVEAVYQGSYADSVTKLSGKMTQPGSDLPDIMQLDATGKVLYATSGCAYTVDQAVAEMEDNDLSRMLGAAMGNWNYGGVQLGMPFATSTTVMYYNKTLLDSLELTAPDTFEDIAGMANVIPQTDENDEAYVLYACVPNTPTLANWLGQMGSCLVEKRNGSEGRADRLDCIEDGSLEQFLAAWKTLYQAGGVVNNSGSTDAFVAGKQLLMTSSSSNIRSMTEKVGDRFEVGVAMYPRVNAQAASGATVSGSCLVMFDNEDAKHEAQWAFVRYLTGAQVQADFAAATGYVPSNMDAMETETYSALVGADARYAVALEQLKLTPAEMRSVTVGPSADFYYAVMSCISDMLDQDLTVDETVDIMDDELNGMLRRYAMSNPD